LIDGEWMKICSCKECDLAGQYQPIGSFHNKRHSKDKLASQCKACVNEHKRIFNKKPEAKKRQSENHKKWYAKNREGQREYRKQYNSSEQGRRKKKEYQHNWRADNKEPIKNYQREYRQTKQHKETRKRWRSQPHIRCMLAVSECVRQALKKQGAKKDYKTFQMLPYSPQDLKEHIEKQFDEKMNWDNYGDYWHIDHIIPQAALPYESLEDKNFQKCWALENLQPLEAVENIRKGSLYEGERHTYTNNKETSNGYEEDT